MSYISNFGLSPRRTVVFSKPLAEATSSGLTTQMGSAFIILNAQVTLPDFTGKCRVRFYSDSSSSDIDYNRAEDDYNVDDSVALIADINFSGSAPINFNLPIIGNTFNNGQVYYNISGSSTDDLFNSIQVTVFPIAEDQNSQVDRKSLSITVNSMAIGAQSLGTITTSPKSFIILSGSATARSRLRIYSRPYTEIPAGEISRNANILPDDDPFSLLIADMHFERANVQYPFVPAVEAYTWSSSDRSVGNNQLGYILENLSGGIVNLSVNLYIYNTED